MIGLFEAEDLKQLDRVITAFKRATFKELSGPEVLSVALGFDWLSSLKEKIEKDLAPPLPPLPAPLPEPIPSLVQKAGTATVGAKKKKS